ncbi:C40 family peptidase [Nonlabens sp.]|uniref:C40 family peptidase n=1 Tax=Nonlabens sp. TaxID=1888209 RepID=UPI003F696207
MLILIPLSRKRIYKTTLKRTILALFTILLLVGNGSCKSSKPRVVTTKKGAAKHRPGRVYKPSRTVKTSKDVVMSTNENTSALIKSAIKVALSYKGTRYKYGGSSRSGMDCSGLIHVSFKEAGKSVPRTSASLFDAAQLINFNQIQKGDLLFFATGKNKSKVNHVGLVVNKTPAEVSFVHASSSRGVMVSTMNEAYWLKAYLSAGRLK